MSIAYQFEEDETLPYCGFITSISISRRKLLCKGLDAFRMLIRSVLSAVIIIIRSSVIIILGKETIIGTIEPRSRRSGVPNLLR